MIALSLYLHTLVPSYGPLKKLEKNGMLVSWEQKGSYWEFEMSSPSQGWMAIGFNEKEGLAGTNLIMGAIKEGKVELSDRYIIRTGFHVALTDLSVVEKLELIGGEEDKNGSRISFRIPMKSQDYYHKNLHPASSFYLLLAYSQEDDFKHHSMMRTSVKITL
ncbi:MAG: DOMON domain-containing protein [Bacteroidota bacterium]